jgi:indole-3-glycerol phosphate synthase
VEKRGSMTGVLDAILERKRAEVWLLHAHPSYVRIPDGPRRGLVDSTLRRASGAPLRLIAEIKRKSPSAGALSTVLAADARARAYAAAGASMVSVLTDGEFFGGSWDDLVDVRRVLPHTPILAKEFIIDERQLVEAASCGADAALIIVRIVPPDLLPKLVTAALHLGLEPFVEVVSEDELARTLATDARVIGVNARDLDALAMDTARATRVLAAIPPDRIAVRLSGIKVPADVAAVASSRADAALIGESLMREDDPAHLLSAFVNAASG